jgi:hypothetical protein
VSSAHFGKKQFNTPGFMPVNLSNSVESVDLEILQVGKKLNEQQSAWQTGKSARNVSSFSAWFTVRRFGRLLWHL